MKNKGCKYCITSEEGILLSNENMNFDNRDYYVYINENLLVFLESDNMGLSHIDDIKINYCPICGRKL